MQCTAATLTEFAANPRWLGCLGAFTLVLHTWTQDLQRHLHVHALMACWAKQLAGNGASDGVWCVPKRARNFLFPVHALSKVFRAKFMQALQQAGDAGALARDPAATALARARRVRALRNHDWVVYAKTPLAGPAAVLDYLSRYTHRTAIGNERLVGIVGDQVLLRVCADGTGGKRTIAMPGDLFIGRLLQHVSAPGLQAHPPLRAAGSGDQDRADGAGAQAAGNAASEPAGARGRAGLHAPCGRHRRRVLPALQARGSGTGSSWSTAALIARPSQRPCWPHAEVRRDAHARPHSVSTVGLRTQARAPLRRPCATLVANVRPSCRWQRSCNKHRHCRHGPLKLTLHIPPQVRRFSPTRFIRRHAKQPRSATVGSASDKRYSLSVLRECRVISKVVEH